MQRILVGIGSGRCGTTTLAQVLDRQMGFSVSHEAWPVLPWRPIGEPGESTEAAAARVIAARIERLRRERQGVAVVGDVASFYLPYLPAALEQEPDLVVICLRRPRDEVVASFEAWCDRVFPLSVDSWTGSPGAGRHHDPVWTPIMPHYDEPTRAAGISRYWDEYYAEVQRLQHAWPGRIRVFPTEALNDRAALKELLAFAGVPEGTQVLPAESSVQSRVSSEAGTAHARPPQPGPLPHGEVVRRGEIECGGEGDSAADGLGSPSYGGERANASKDAPCRRRPAYGAGDPRRCVVLVPFGSHIVRACERGLIELQKRGYEVRRVSGYANIDMGRSQMATDALIDGFEETMWIDSDVEFDPDDALRLRAHGEPIVCGIYPKKGLRELACHILPGTESITFGKEGGLHEILYAATGFLHVRREVYETIQCRLPLPVANVRFGKPLVPFFEPMTKPDADGFWTMTEDYSFCERARQCGYRILAETTIRLTHHGSYGYTWEDAGSEKQRFATYRYHFE